MNSRNLNHLEFLRFNEVFAMTNNNQFRNQSLSLRHNLKNFNCIIQDSHYEAKKASWFLCGFWKNGFWAGNVLCDNFEFGGRTSAIKFSRLENLWLTVRSPKQRQNLFLVVWVEDVIFRDKKQREIIWKLNSAFWSMLGIFLTSCGPFSHDGVNFDSFQIT